MATPEPLRSLSIRLGAAVAAFMNPGRVQERPDKIDRLIADLAKDENDSERARNASRSWMAETSAGHVVDTTDYARKLIEDLRIAP